jgi:hypothetical protein
LAYHLAQIFLMLHDLARQVGIQQRGADDAATAPDPRYGFKIQIIPVFV